MNNIFKLIRKQNTNITNFFDSYKLINKNVLFTIPIFFILLFMIDYSGLMNLWDENYIRRLMNMYRRRDPLTYENILKPFCQKYVKVLDDKDLKKLQSIKMHNKLDIPWVSRTNTTTIYYNNLSDEEKKYIDDVKLKVKKHYEKAIGKKLYPMKNVVKNNTTNIYIYHGKNSKHLWHVDPNNKDTIYNCIVCIDREGDISPLQCKDSSKNVNSIHFQPGDAAFFNGGTTIHQVPPNDDENSKRTVLSLAYTSEKKLVLQNKKSEINGQNMCTYISGGSNIGNILRMYLSTFVIIYILSKLSNVSLLSYKTLFVFMFLTYVLVKYIPLYYNTGLGSGRSSSIKHNIIISAVTVATMLNIKGSLLFASYFMLSDQIFPTSWVGYD